MHLICECASVCLCASRIYAKFNFYSRHSFPCINWSFEHRAPKINSIQRRHLDTKSCMLFFPFRFVSFRFVWFNFYSLHMEKIHWTIQSLNVCRLKCILFDLTRMWDHKSNQFLLKLRWIFWDHSPFSFERYINDSKTQMWSVSHFVRQQLLELKLN